MSSDSLPAQAKYAARALALTVKWELHLGCASMRSRDTMNSAQQGPCRALGIGPNHFSNVSLHTCKPTSAWVDPMCPIWLQETLPVSGPSQGCEAAHDPAGKQLHVHCARRILWVPLQPSSNAATHAAMLLPTSNMHVGQQSHLFPALLFHGTLQAASAWC